jgi:hypothetical protein
MGALQAESETRHRAATRLNNDAVAKASQGPQNRKSLKRLPHRTRTADFTNTPIHAGSRLRDSVDAGGRGKGRPALPEISYFATEF